jgi:23S rRNA (uridine2552-2'-O)-methyltransferase
MAQDGGAGKRPKRSGGPGAARALKTRLRTAKGRKTSSTRWLERQLNDPYIVAAKAQGYRSRAAFKLREIDDRLHLLRPGARVVDLGAAPGGWSQVALARVRADEGRGRVVAVDVAPMAPIAGAEILTLDFLDPEAPERIKAALGGPADVVLSDMAAPATGHRQTDHLRIMALCEAAAEFAEEVLAPNGAFCAKVLQGGAEAGLLDRLKRAFAHVRHVKPPASRSDSAEIYVVATGFRGATSSCASGAGGPS